MNLQYQCYYALVDGLHTQHENVWTNNTISSLSFQDWMPHAAARCFLRISLYISGVAAFLFSGQTNDFKPRPLSLFILFLRCVGLWVIWLRHGRIGGMFKNDCKFGLSLSHVSSSFTVATQHATRIFWLSKSLKSIKSTIFGWFMSVCVCLSSWVCYIVGFIGLILFIHLPRCLRGLLCQPNCQKAVWPACEPSDNLGRGFMYENMFSIQQWMRQSNLTTIPLWVGLWLLLEHWRPKTVGSNAR